MPVFPVIDIQTFDFKTSIIAIKLFIVMILNLYLISEQSQIRGVKSDFAAAVL